MIVCTTCLILCFSILVNGFDYKDVRCGVCTRLVEEIARNVSKVDTRKMINVSGFRLDDRGNYDEKKVPYYRSEVFLTELMETICHRMDDYVRATYKSDGRFTVLPLMLDGGKMNPAVSDVDIVQDSDLNKSLKYYCEDILEEFDEIFVSQFSKEADIVPTEICVQVTRICDESMIGPELVKEEL